MVDTVPAPSTRPQTAKKPLSFSHRARKIFLIVHLWIGLGLGIWFALVGVTGSVVAWRSEISAAEWRSQFPVKEPAPGTKIIPLSQALTAIQAANPEASPSTFASLRVPRADLPFYAFPMRGKDGVFRIAAVNPYTGEAYSAREIPSLIGTIEELHTHLLLKDAGNTANGILAFIAVSLLLSGLWLWWPQHPRLLKTRLTIKRNTSLQRTLYDLHNVLGIYLFPVVLVTVITAAYLVGNKLFQASRPTPPPPVAATNGGNGGARSRTGRRGNMASGNTAPQAGGRGRRYTGPRVAPSADGATISLDTLVETAAQAVPGQELVEVSLPQQPEHALRVMYRRDIGLTKYGLLYLDPYNGRVVETTPTYNSERATPLTQISEGLHYGAYGGIFTKLLYTVAGLMPLSLFVTGTWMWIRKKLVKRKKQAQR